MIDTANESNDVNEVNEANEANTETEDNDGLLHDVDVDSMMLSTIDNPFNPKTEYDMWKRYDQDNHHNTEEYIARLISMEGEYDVDDEFTLNVLTSKVINDILENDEHEIYRLI